MSDGAAVVYVCDGYPRLAETFTSRDVRALRAAGILDRVVSLHRPASHDPALDPVTDPPVDYLPLPFGPRVLSSWLAWLVRRPVETLRLSLRCLLPYSKPFTWAWQVRAPLHVLWGAEVARRVPRGTHLHAQFVGASSTVAWVASRLARGTFSMTAHQDWGLPWVAPKMKDAMFVVAISRTTKEELLAAASSVPAERVVVNHVGVSVPAAQPVTEREQGPTRLLAIGTVGPTKGHDVLVRACALLRARGVPHVLDVVGGGPGLRGLELVVEELGAQDHVTLHGALPHARTLELVQRADVVVLACRVTERGDRDGIPVALMEGMAAGKATVSTSVGAIPELIEDGVSGRLVAPDRPAELAAALEDLARDEGLRARLGAAGRARVAAGFEASASSRGLVAAFRSHLGGPPAGPAASADRAS